MRLTLFFQKIGFCEKNFVNIEKSLLFFLVLCYTTIRQVCLPVFCPAFFGGLRMNVCALGR